MRYERISLSALAAAVALACGGVSAQDREPENRLEAATQRAETAQRQAESAEQQAESADERAEVAEERAEEAEDAQEDAEELVEETAEQDPGDAEDVTASSRQEQGNPERLDELTQEHDNLSTFVEAVKAAGLADSLTGSTSYTVFAPTDEAFESMSEDVQSLFEPQNREQLVELLRAHIVADDVDQEMARTISEARTIDGGTIDISSEDDRLMIGEAGVAEPSIQSGNLRVYAIDQVLSRGTQLAAADPEEQEPAGADVRDEPLSEAESPAQGSPADEEPSTLR